MRFGWPFLLDTCGRRVKLKTLHFQRKTNTCGRHPRQTAFFWHLHALCLPGWTSLSSDDGRLLEYGLTNTLSLKSEFVSSWLLFELSTLETVWKDKNSYTQTTVMAVLNLFFDFPGRFLCQQTVDGSDGCPKPFFRVPWSFSMPTDCSQSPIFP